MRRTADATVVVVVADAAATTAAAVVLRVPVVSGAVRALRLNRQLEMQLLLLRRLVVAVLVRLRGEVAMAGLVVAVVGRVGAHAIRVVAQVGRRRARHVVRPHVAREYD